MSNWNLNDLYLDFDEHYDKDMTRLAALMDDHIAWIQKRDSMTPLALIEGYLERQAVITRLTRGLFAYASLVYATDVNHQEAPKKLAGLQQIMRKATAEDVLFTRYLESVDLEALAQASDMVDTYHYQLLKMQEEGRFLLSEKEEILYARLRELSSSAWGQLQGLMTANLEVKYRDKTVTFSDVRNLAYDGDALVRKDAYEAELKAYEGIDDAIAMSLSNIKREVIIMNELRGYGHALEKTLRQSRMTQKTLNAMIEAMLDSRPAFEQYLLGKATYLGHASGLPFYDLFAPVGSFTKTYTYEEAKQLIIEGFGSYSPSLADYAKKAFDQDWIDVYPKKGKRGGAFCSNQPQIRQSRIMTNFTGSLSDVLTLAHELGHGYHGEMISSLPPLHWSYPMPLAETASIFCETIVNAHLLKSITDPKARLSILENALQGDTQVIIDILSRYLFENELFKQATGPVSKHQLKQMMQDAQKEAYGKGLDADILHPYMWLNKPHYYSAGLNFYNFPYAFGLLFGKGLYAQYQKDPKQFVKAYDILLQKTTNADVEDVATSMGIDVADKAFWTDALGLVIKDIEEVVMLMKKQ